MSWASAVLDTPSRADIERRLRRANSSLSTPALSRAASTNWSSDSTSSQDEDEGVPDALTYPVTPPTSEQVFSTVHTEFGHCANPAFRHTSQHPKGAPVEVHHEIEGPWHALFATYVTLFLVMCLGHLRDFFGKRFRPEIFAHLLPHNVSRICRPVFTCFYTGISTSFHSFPLLTVSFAL
jgi:serine palmitoyltransferase